MLFDFSWISRKLEVAGLNNLIYDYDLAIAEGNALSIDHPLALVRRALLLSSHVILQDPSQLASQLFGRLCNLDIPEIHKLTQIIKTHERQSCLLLQSPSLIPPTSSLVRTLEGHADRVMSAKLLPGKYQVVSASADGMIKVWDLATGQVVQSIETGHTGEIFDLAVTPDGSLAITASDDRSLKIWSLADGVLIRTLIGHKDGVRRLEILPSQHQVVSASFDGSLILWDYLEGNVIWEVQGHNMPILDIAAYPKENRFVTASADCLLSIWDIKNKDKVKDLVGHTQAVTAVCVSRDGTQIISGSDDGRMLVWDTTSGQFLYTLDDATLEVNDIQITDDNKIIYCTAEDYFIKSWDFFNGKALFPLWGHSDIVTSICLSNDLLISASNDRTIKVWDLHIQTLEEGLLDAANAVTALACTSNGEFAASGSTSGDISLWNIQSHKMFTTFHGHQDEISSIIALGDQQFVSASFDKTIRIWNCHTGINSKTHPDNYFSENDFPWEVKVSTKHGLVAAAFGFSNISVWNVRDGALAGTIHDSAEIRAIHLLSDGLSLVTASGDDFLKIWNLKQFQLERKIAGQCSTVWSLVCTPDDRYLVTGSEDCMINVWDMNNESCLHSIHAHESAIKSLAVSPDGNLLASTSEDASLKIWSLPSMRLVDHYHADSGFLSCVFSLDGKKVIAGDKLGYVHFLVFNKEKARFS